MDHRTFTESCTGGCDPSTKQKYVVCVQGGLLYSEFQVEQVLTCQGLRVGVPVQ